MILFTLEFIFIKLNRENHEWYYKIAFQIISLIVSLFRTPFAIPYL